MDIIFEETIGNYKKRTGRYWYFPLSIFLHVFFISFTIVFSVLFFISIDSLFVIKLIFLTLLIIIDIKIAFDLIKSIKEKPVKIIKKKDKIFFLISGNIIDVQDIDYYHSSIPPYLLYRIKGKKLRRKFELTGLDKEIIAEVDKYIPDENRTWMRRKKNVHKT